jgi:hypothetical protein
MPLLCPEYKFDNTDSSHMEPETSDKEAERCKYVRISRK